MPSSSQQQQEWLEFYLGLCPGPHAGGDTEKVQKDQTNPHATSEYAELELEADQTLGRVGSWFPYILGSHSPTIFRALPFTVGGSPWKPPTN